MQKLIGIAAALLATVMLAGSALAVSIPYPPTGAKGDPILTISYQVINDEDSGAVPTTWALDNFARTVTVWATNTTGTYVANVADIGTFCTYAGAHSPQTGTPITYDGCGTMVGGEDISFTASSGPSSTASPGPQNYGGTKADIIAGVENQVKYSWLNAYFTGASVVTEDPWGWTYTLTAGANPQWVNAATGNGGDIVTDSQSATAAANIVCTQQSDCPALYGCVNQECVQQLCGLTATGGIQFGSVVQGTTVQSPDTTTVTNTGNVQITPKIFGNYWFGSQYPGSPNNYMPIGATSWYTTSVGTWTSLTDSNSPASIGTPLSPFGGQATVYYQLTVPAQQPTDSYTQQITYSTSCDD